MNIPGRPSTTDVWCGVLYACQSGPNGPIKIGSTTVRADARVSALQQSSPWKLILLAEWSGVPQEELAHHLALAPHRIRGEWYWPTRPVLDRIREAVEASRERHDEILAARLRISGTEDHHPILATIYRPDVFVRRA